VTAPARSPRIVIGGVARAHGIKGEVVIFTHDADTPAVGTAGTLWVGGTARKVIAARDTHRGWLVAFEGVVTRNDAELLKGQVVEVDRAALELADDDVLLSDLIGCAVKLVDGRAWGTIAEIQATDAQDLLVIHDGAVERLLPLVDVFVKDIDLDARVVTIDPPDGLPENPR
jgi:16S rRNA processing protein RimM